MPAHAARGRGRGAASRRQEDFSDFFSSLFGGETPFAGAGARAARDHHARVDITLEEAFRGTTRTLELRRPQLREDGNVELTTHTVRVTIPAGVTQGQLIRLAGQGGAAGEGGAAGDLYLEVHILPQQLFALDGRDVTLIFPVAPWEVALGASVTVPTLGGSVEMHIPGGRSSGQKLRSARTWASRLTARGSVRTAEGRAAASANSPEAKALYEQMREKLNFNPRADFAR